MTLQEFIMDSVRKIPHPSVIGEVADLVYEKVCKLQKESNFWGLDSLDYFKHCSLFINGEDKTEWFISQIDKLNKISCG